MSSDLPGSTFSFSTRVSQHVHRRRCSQGRYLVLWCIIMLLAIVCQRVQKKGKRELRCVCIFIIYEVSS